MKRCLICLQELDLFRGLEQEHFTNLCQCTNRKRLSRGLYLFHQGDKTNTVYLIKSGKLKLVQSTGDGQKTSNSTLINLKITQQELADMIGSSRVMVIQALNELKAANIIEKKKKYYFLKNDPCLSAHIFK